MRSRINRSKTKGKVETPAVLSQHQKSDRPAPALAGRVASSRVHATTFAVNGPFAREGFHLPPLPLAPFRSVLKLERRISREGMVSGGGKRTDESQADIAGQNPRRTRADAQRSEDAVLEAAKAVFATSGVDAPVRRSRPGQELALPLFIAVSPNDPTWWRRCSCARSMRVQQQPTRLSQRESR